MSDEPPEVRDYGEPMTEFDRIMGEMLLNPNSEASKRVREYMAGATLLEIARKCKENKQLQSMVILTYRSTRE